VGSNPSQPAIDSSNNYLRKNKVSIDTLERLLRLRNLTDKTIETYLSCYNTLTKFAGKKEITQHLVEDYLLQAKNRRNNLAMLKLAWPDLVKDCRFPRIVPKPKFLPNKGQVITFFTALPDKYKGIFLALASSGLRVSELLSANIDKNNRMLVPEAKTGSTKHAWVSFYNEEAASLLENGFPQITVDGLSHVFKKVSKKTGIRIYPHLLRAIFAREMSLKGVQDRYIDAFCGRVPGSVLARHYSDFSPEVLKEIYDKANLKILS
jgi:integrase